MKRLSSKMSFLFVCAGLVTAVLAFGLTEIAELSLVLAVGPAMLVYYQIVYK